MNHSKPDRYLQRARPQDAAVLQQLAPRLSGTLESATVADACLEPWPQELAAAARAVIVCWQNAEAVAYARIALATDGRAQQAVLHGQLLDHVELPLVRVITELVSVHAAFDVPLIFYRASVNIADRLGACLVRPKVDFDEPVHIIKTRALLPGIDPDARWNMQTDTIPALRSVIVLAPEVVAQRAAACRQMEKDGDMDPIVWEGDEPFPGA